MVRKNVKFLNSKKENGNKNAVNKKENKENQVNKEDSGYDIEGLMSGNKKALKVKRRASYLISKTTAEERRKKLGL